MVHTCRGMGAEDYCTCDGPWPCPDAPGRVQATKCAHSGRPAGGHHKGVPECPDCMDRLDAVTTPARTQP